MLTSDFKKKNEQDKMNDSQSTLIGFAPSVRAQVETFSNLINGDQQSAKKARKEHRLDLKKLKVEEDTLNATRNSAMDNTARQQQSALSKVETLENKHIKNKKEKLDIYNKIDREYFTSDKPQDPL